MEHESDINNIDYEIRQKQKRISCRDEITQEQYDIPLAYNGHYYVEEYVPDVLLIHHRIPGTACFHALKFF